MTSSVDRSGWNNPDEKLLCEILSQKLQEGRTFGSLIVTTFSIFIVVSGGVLKFALDPDGDQIQRAAFCIAGALTSATYLSACVFFVRIRRSFCQDIEDLNVLLGAALLNERFLVIKYATIPASAFSAMSLIGWIALLFISST